MSRSNQRTSSKRSKMDRYTEDLKYSLRNRLSESVGRGSLRTDDILARNHRQIVSDFTDPRQWYYSATHDYIIALMRESHKLNGGSVWGSRGSRRGERDSSSTPRGHSSPAMLAKEGRRGENGGSFIEIPTMTSADLQEIRGAGETRHRDTSDTKHKQSKETAKGIGLDRGYGSSTQTLTSKENTKNGDRFVQGRISPEGKSSIASKQDATVPLHVNTDHDISVPSTDLIKSDIPVSAKSEDTSEEYTVSAMEAYRVSKQTKTPHIISRKQNVPLASAGHINNYFPGKIESFVPVGKRSKATGKTTAVYLPQIGKTVQTEQPESQRTNLYKVRRGMVGSRKRRLCPLTSLDRVSAKTDDLPYVEDWIRKIQIDGKDLSTDKHLEPIERVDETFPHISKQHPHMANDPHQLMNLPSDFDPVPGLQPFQPHPSLYLYSLKQKSDLNVKFQYLNIPKPVKQLADQSGTHHKHSFKNDLTQARSKVNYIEDRLGELYQAETNLDRIVSRQQIKSLKKHNGRFLDISTGLTNRFSDQYVSLQERSVENHEHDEGCLPKDPVEKETVSLSKVADGGQSNMNTIELGLSSEEPPSASKDDGPTSNTSKSSTQGDDFHATSTSSWKQQCPVSPGKPKDGRAVEGKTLRIFHERGDGIDVHVEDQTVKVVKNGQEGVIASIQDCNTSGSAVDSNAQTYVTYVKSDAEDGELAEDKTGSRLSVAVLEILNDIVNRLESPESIMDHPLSSDVSGTAPTEDVAVEMKTNERTTNRSEIDMKEQSSQQTINTERQCSFCDEPH